MRIFETMDNGKTVTALQQQQGRSRQQRTEPSKNSEEETSTTPPRPLTRSRSRSRSRSVGRSLRSRSQTPGVDDTRKRGRSTSPVKMKDFEDKLPKRKKIQRPSTSLGLPYKDLAGSDFDDNDAPASWRRSASTTSLIEISDEDVDQKKAESECDDRMRSLSVSSGSDENFRARSQTSSPESVKSERTYPKIKMKKMNKKQRSEMFQPLMLEDIYVMAKLKPLTTTTTGEPTEPCTEDRFCWSCHRDGKHMIQCTACPRVFHLRCTKCTTLPDPDSHWVCSVCISILDVETTDNKRDGRIPLGQLCNLFTYAIQSMKETEGSEPFWKAVDTEVHKFYRCYIVYPMDLSLLTEKVRRRSYGSTEAFEADARWILHNCIVFNAPQHNLTAIAKKLMRACHIAMNAIESCPHCYLRGFEDPDNFFTEVCLKPHLPVWAKLKGFPYWPAKVMRMRADEIEVRFFGDHDRSYIQPKDCFLFSKLSPAVTQNRRAQDKLKDAMEELQEYIANLSSRFGQFCYFELRTPFDPSRQVEQLMACLPNYTQGEESENSSNEHGSSKVDKDSVINKTETIATSRRSPASTNLKRKLGEENKRLSYKSETIRTYNKIEPQTKDLSVPTVDIIELEEVRDHIKNSFAGDVSPPPRLESPEIMTRSYSSTTFETFEKNMVNISNVMTIEKEVFDRVDNSEDDDCYYNGEDDKEMSLMKTNSTQPAMPKIKVIDQSVLMGSVEREPNTDSVRECSQTNTAKDVEEHVPSYNNNNTFLKLGEDNQNIVTLFTTTNSLLKQQGRCKVLRVEKTQRDIEKKFAASSPKSRKISDFGMNDADNSASESELSNLRTQKTSSHSPMATSDHRITGTRTAMAESNGITGNRATVPRSPARIRSLYQAGLASFSSPSNSKVVNELQDVGELSKELLPGNRIPEHGYSRVSTDREGNEQSSSEVETSDDNSQESVSENVPLNVKPQPVMGDDSDAGSRPFKTVNREFRSQTGTSCIGRNKTEISFDGAEKVLSGNIVSGLVKVDTKKSGTNLLSTVQVNDVFSLAPDPNAVDPLGPDNSCTVMSGVGKGSLPTNTVRLGISSGRNSINKCIDGGRSHVISIKNISPRVESSLRKSPVVCDVSDDEMAEDEHPMIDLTKRRTGCMVPKPVSGEKVASQSPLKLIANMESSGSSSESNAVVESARDRTERYLDPKTGEWRSIFLLDKATRAVSPAEEIEDPVTSVYQDRSVLISIHDDDRPKQSERVFQRINLGPSVNLSKGISLSVVKDRKSASSDTGNNGRKTPSPVTSEVTLANLLSSPKQNSVPLRQTARKSFSQSIASSPNAIAGTSKSDDRRSSISSSASRITSPSRRNSSSSKHCDSLPMVTIPAANDVVRGSGVPPFSPGYRSGMKQHKSSSSYAQALLQNNQSEPPVAPVAWSYAIQQEVLQVIQNAIQERANCDPNTTLAALQDQLTQQSYRHAQEIKELKHYFKLSFSESQASFALALEHSRRDHQRVQEEAKRAFEKRCQELERLVDMAKKKQWCTVCGEEAQLYCCWNTSYCDYSCQETHWKVHMEVCRQKEQDHAHDPETHTQEVPANNTSSVSLKPSTLYQGSNVPPNRSRISSPIRIPTPPLRSINQFTLQRPNRDISQKSALRVTVSSSPGASSPHTPRFTMTPPRASIPARLLPSSSQANCSAVRPHPYQVVIPRPPIQSGLSMMRMSYRGQGPRFSPPPLRHHMPFFPFESHFAAPRFHRPPGYFM